MENIDVKELAYSNFETFKKVFDDAFGYIDKNGIINKNG